jgi:hypothetical protein
MAAPERTWLARLWPAATFQFCFIAAVAMLKPGANALVLSHFDAGTLPWLYLVAAVLTGGLSLFPAKAFRLGPSSLALGGGVVTLALASGVALELKGAPLLAYVFAEALGTQVSLSFWGAMGEAFDAREARKAFTWINGIGMSGAIAGGFLAQVLARTVGALALLVAGGLLALAAAFAFRFHRSAFEAEAVKARRALQFSLDGAYPRLLAAVVLGFAMLSNLTDYVFRQRAASWLQESGMADLFASHQLWTGVFCVIFQFLLAEQLLKRLGILRYVGLIPVALGAFTLLCALSPSVWGAWGLKLVESAASWSLLPVAFQLLYAPMPDQTRDATRRTIDGVVRKVGMAVAGLTLVALASTLGSTGVLALVGVVCVAVGGLLWRMRPLYIEAVHTRVAGVRVEAVEFVEERLLLEALKSPSAEKALRAVDLLEHAEVVDESHVKLLLGHPHERVQERGVLLAEQHALVGCAKLLEGLIHTATRRPRDAAVWALARLSPERARVVLPVLLDSGDVGLRTSAIGGLLIVPPPHDGRAEAALQELLARTPRAPAAERREVARLLGRVGRPALSPSLQRMLDDVDGTVRRVAIGAVGTGHYVDLAPRLLRFLTWRDERRITREALARLGEALVPMLAHTLDDRLRGTSVRLQLPRVLRQIGTQSAFEALLYANSKDDPALHYRVGGAFSRMHEEHPEFTVDREQVMAALERRREAFVRLLGPSAVLRVSLGDASLLTRAVRDRLDQAFELTFWLLGLLHPEAGLRRVRAQLIGGDARRRAWAIELLDNVLTEDERVALRPVVNARHHEPRPGDADELPRALSMLCATDDHVLRSCARRVARQEERYAGAPREDDMSDVTLKRLFALEGVEIFAQSDVDDLAAVAQVAREQRFRQGERVYTEGDPGDALYVIVEGTAEARRDGEVVLTMHAKESFGETSLFDGAPRINEVVATTDLAALVIDRRDFLDLLGDRPELLSGMFRVLSRQLKSMVVAGRKIITGEVPVVPARSAPRAS